MTVEIQNNREIDMAVAEHVLKLVPRRIMVPWYSHEITLFFAEEPVAVAGVEVAQLIVYSWDAGSCNAMIYRNGVDDKNGTAPALPHFSLEIEAAWEVIDAMRDNEKFHERMATVFITRMSSEDAARAICLAALEVV